MALLHHMYLKLFFLSNGVIKDKDENVMSHVFDTFLLK